MEVDLIIERGEKKMQIDEYRGILPADVFDSLNAGNAIQFECAYNHSSFMNNRKKYEEYVMSWIERITNHFNECKKTNHKLKYHIYSPHNHAKVIIYPPGYQESNTTLGMKTEDVLY